MKSSTIGKILIVDDEVELKNILVEALASQGYETSGFTSGEAAIAALRVEAFDVLLTDLMMDGMDGIATVREAMQIDPNLICIMMTGQGTIQTAVGAMKVGAFDYVVKPFRLQTMLPVLTRAMNARHLRLENVQLREAVAIHELSETIAFTLDCQTVLSKLADGALVQSEADEVSILLPSSDGKELYVAAVRGDKRERLLGQRIPLHESISSWVARERLPLILNGAVRDERFVALWPRADIRSAVSVPMQVANKLVGIINLNMTNRLRPFTLGQMKALTILAGTAAAALESASLHTQVQEAEQKYRSIFENAVEGIFQATPEGRFITVNPSLARIMGYDSPQEMIVTVTTPGQFYVDPESRAEAARIEKDEGVLRGFQFQAYRKDGAKIWLSGNRHSVRDKAGVELYCEGSVEDITERKWAEAQRVRLAALVDASPDFIGYADPKTTQIKYVNRYGRRMCGIGEDEDLEGIKISDVHPAWMNQRMADVILPAAVRDGVWEGDAAFLHRNGREIPVSMALMARKDANGEVDIFYTVSRDITERKRAEDDLRESEERYRDLVENAHDIIYSHDLNGQYTSINKAGEVITGYTREEALALNLSQTVAPEYIGEAREMIRKKITGEKVTAYELELIAKDGHRITVEANTKLVFLDGVPVGVQGIARDVTERKHLEDQLRQSQKLEGIGQLAGGIAHDFNNLLTAINGYSSLALQRIEGNASVRTYLEEIKKAGDRAANLTRQLLAFGRKQILQPLPLSLNDIVTDMNKMLQRLIGEDIQLSAKLTTDLKRVKADPGQIEQVLVNLIVNARDAMPHGGKLTIETANTELGREYAGSHVGVLPGAYVVLAVSDTGCGMDEQVRKQIFEPFFTTKEKGKGTGLGLSTVYGIVKQSGGNIWVYSEPNRGTTFKVYLPALAATPESTEVSAVEHPILGGSETVLLVEDEEVVRGLARQILEDAGYRVLVARQGDEAIRLCNEHAKEIHLLLTDVVMPGAGGKEVADRLGSLRPGIKVLFMSGYTDEAIVHHGVLDSNVKFIQKPFSPAALARKVREVLDSNGKVSMV